jgi:hypothetical protein
MWEVWRVVDVVVKVAVLVVVRHMMSGRWWRVVLWVKVVFCHLMCEVVEGGQGG